jgi:hypothetical protein
MFRKTLVTGVLTGATMLAFASPALAYDCFNASRSAQGSVAAASNAGTWWDVPEILAELGGLSDEQIAKVMPVINADPRVPADFTVFFNPAHPGELAAKMNPKNATDGKGIDHSDDYETAVFDAIFEDVAIALS